MGALPAIFSGMKFKSWRGHGQHLGVRWQSGSVDTAFRTIARVGWPRRCALPPQSKVGNLRAAVRASAVSVEIAHIHLRRGFFSRIHIIGDPFM